MESAEESSWDPTNKGKYIFGVENRQQISQINIAY
jgi:hypothetical protein